jgi:hypothetical protein
MGLAAWQGTAVFGDKAGPPIVNWLVGGSDVLPDGATVCPLPNDVGLLRLPGYEKLFWSREPVSGRVAATSAATLIWELDVFTAATRGASDVKMACEEVLGRGGARLVLALIKAHEDEATEQETFLRQLLKILHRLVLYAPLERDVQHD